MLRHRLFERAVPFGQLRGLVLKALGLARDGIVKRLLAQHRAHACEQRPVLEGLGQIVVAAGVQPLDHVPRVGFRGDKNDRDRSQRVVRLEHAHHADAVELRHHDVEQDQIRLEVSRFREALFTIRGGFHCVAVRLETHAQDLEVFRRIVDRKNARRIVQGPVSFRKGTRESLRAARAD